MQTLSGRVAAITGAASGIGPAIAEALGRAGVRVAMIDINPRHAPPAGPHR